MVVAMAIIIGFSSAMHVYLIKKKAIKAHRYEPTYGERAKPTASKAFSDKGVVEGEVIAVSFDKFFLRINDRVQPFKVAQHPLPQVGQRLSISYAGGDPPVVEEMRELPPGH